MDSLDDEECEGGRVGLGKGDPGKVGPIYTEMRRSGLCYRRCREGGREREERRGVVLHLQGKRNGNGCLPVGFSTTVLLDLLGISVCEAVFGEILGDVVLGASSAVGKSGVVAVVQLVRSGHCQAVASAPHPKLL